MKKYIFIFLLIFSFFPFSVDATSSNNVKSILNNLPSYIYQDASSYLGTSTPYMMAGYSANPKSYNFIFADRSHKPLNSGYFGSPTSISGQKYVFVQYNPTDSTYSYQERTSSMYGGNWAISVVNMSSHTYRIFNFESNFGDVELVNFTFPRGAWEIIPGTIQELPLEIMNHGGIVLSTVLIAFGVLLVVSLIPRLVRLFLY